MFDVKRRAMRVLFVLDPLEQLQLETDTSLLLAEEFRRRGHETWFATEAVFRVDHAGVFVRAWELHVAESGAPHAGLELTAPVKDFTLVLMRQDPPVDAHYRFVAQALGFVAAEVAVVNDPASVLQWNEKLLPLRFPAYCPPTIASHDPEELLHFVRQEGTAVVKPLSDCSGRGIRIVDVASAPSAIEAVLAAYPGEPVIVQRYLPEVARGDKRIFLANGQFVGAVNRVPSGPGRLANIHQGARVESTTLSEREREIVAVVGEFLQRQRLWLAGLDVIGGFLTEVNITSPSALRQINAVTGEHLETMVVDILEGLARDLSHRSRQLTV